MALAWLAPPGPAPDALGPQPPVPLPQGSFMLEMSSLSPFGVKFDEKKKLLGKYLLGNRERKISLSESS